MVGHTLDENVEAGDSHAVTPEFGSFEVNSHWLKYVDGTSKSHSFALIGVGRARAREIKKRNYHRSRSLHLCRKALLFKQSE
jgi:hypothetical protein